MWSICWHPVQLHSRGGRVAFGILDLPVLLLRRLRCPFAAVPFTFVATTGQFVGGQGCWDVEGSRWRVQQFAFAQRQGRGSQSTRVVDLDFHLLPAGRLRLWQTGCQLEQLCSAHDARRKTPTLCWAPTGRQRVWWCWVCEKEGGPMRKSRLVPLLEHIIGLQRQVLRWIWCGRRDPLNHSRA